MEKQPSRDRIPAPEAAPSIDFLDENLVVSFSLEEGAANYLPEVSPEDLESRRERYRIFLGTHTVAADGSVHLQIKGTMEMDGDDHGFYKEAAKEITDIKMDKILREVKGIQQTYPEYRDFHLVGDIHTHPFKPSEFEGGISPWDPSQPDIASVADLYRLGLLSSTQPFIFGIVFILQNHEEC